MKYKFSKQKKINITIAYKNLLDFVNVFYKSRVKIFLLYGTLLGMYRERKLINGDNDLDLGCFAEKFRSRRIKIIKLLKNNGFILVKENKSLINFVRANEHIDLYLFHKLPLNIGRFSMNFLILNKFLKNLNVININKNKFYVPSNTELFLEKCYGAEWRKPIKNVTAKNNFILKFIHFVLPKSIIKFLGKLLTKK